MRGTFRRDLHLVRDARHPGAFRLARRPGPRLLSVALVVAGGLATALDVLTHRPWIATLQLALSVAFIGILVRAEIDPWRVEGEEVVRRTLLLPRLSLVETRLGARQIERVAVAHEGPRARAWIETTSGEQYALVEGPKADVEKVVETLSRAVKLAAMQSAGGLLH